MLATNNLEQARAEAQARLVAIIESSDDAIISKTLEGVVTSWNRGAERIFGWTAAEAIGRPITLIIPDDRLTEEPQILSRIRSGERVDHFETIRKTKDGRLIDISVTISPVRDDAGKVIGVSKVARDITIQKRFQQELGIATKAAEDARAVAERAKEEAETANRAKDHFLSILSHELRTPLTPVLVAIGIVERDATLPPHLAEHIDMIRRNVETEARLVDDLLDLTRIARGKLQLHFEATDVHGALRNVVSMLQSEIDNKGLTLAMTLRAKQTQVLVDPGRFQQILLNLISNAVKFTPTDGTVTLRTSNLDGEIEVEIIDTGVGIEPDVLPRLFRPFEQGERTITREFGGLGLGLSIVKSLVELHRATISASSEGKDKGATFILRMPTMEPMHLASTELSSDVTNLPAAGLRVLLVEDHNDTRQMMELLLSSFGCIVTAVGTVKSAIAASERQTFDLLLSDIGLPDGSGIDVMRYLAAAQAIPGIAISGFGQDDDFTRSRDAGFITHLTKPVNVQVLEDAIRRVRPLTRNAG